MLPALADTPQSVQEVSLNKCFLTAPINPSFFALKSFEAIDWTKEDYIQYIRQKYPKMADLLICMWKNESSFGVNMVGDSGRAIGHFQIWTSIHDITNNCANDFFCSLDWTANQIEEGRANLWTTYSICK